MSDTAARAQFEDDQRLMLWLGQIYRSDVLGVGSREKTAELARGAVQADQRLLAAAGRRIAELEPVCATRDRQTAYVEHRQLEYLRGLVAA